MQTRCCSISVLSKRLIDCVMCEGIRSRQEAMANVCFFNFLPRIVTQDSLAPKAFDTELQAKCTTVEKMRFGASFKAAWLVGRSLQGYSAPIIRETLGVEPAVIVWSPGMSERPRWENPRSFSGYNVGSVRIPGIVKELAASHVEEISKLVTEDFVRVDQVAVGIVLVDELAFEHGANTPE